MKTFIIKDRPWRFIKSCLAYQLWVADYWCPDGDGIRLYIGDGYFELSCFSGIGGSTIKMHDIDFTYLDKVDIDFTEPFEVQAVKVADYFCRLFCEYRN